MRPAPAVLLAAAALAVASCVPPTPVSRQVVLSGLDRPWDIAFAPDATMLFTERVGRVSAWDGSGAPTVMLNAPADLLPGSEGGMLGLAVDPSFSSNRFIYTCYTSSAPGGSGDVRVVRWTVNGAYTAIGSPTPIVTGMPRTSGRHSGCRPRFKPGTNHLYIATGDAAKGSTPQDITSLGGKVLRVNRNGTAPGSNPFVGRPGDDRIYTFGHRNVQGLAFRGSGNKPYSVEHGTGCDDEINKLYKGANYGWDPWVPGGGYDESVPMTDLAKFPNAVAASWSSGCPTVAPSGATFVDGAQWGTWERKLAVGMLKQSRLRFFDFSNGGRTAVGVGKRFNELGLRLRSVVQGPDGHLYVATDEVGAAGQIWRVTPG